MGQTQYSQNVDKKLLIDAAQPVAFPGILFGRGGGWFKKIQLTEDRENGDLGAVAP